jgi:hypothetical protein
MTGYEMELRVRDRMQALRAEADSARLARIAAPAPKRGRSWRPKLSLALVRHLVRVAQAS